MLALLLTLIVGYFLLWAAAEAFNEYSGYPVFRPLTPGLLWDHLCRWWRILNAAYMHRKHKL